MYLYNNSLLIFFSLIIIFSCKTVSVVGCQNPVACNYNENASIAGECIYSDEICDTCSGQRDGTGWIVDNDSNGDGVCDQYYDIDENGNIIYTEFSLSDFDPAQNCQGCHPTHYQEWSESMHAYSMRDPIFFSGKKQAQDHFPLTGERFCIQCHSPAAFLTGEDLTHYDSAEKLMNSGLPAIITDGISCDICHTTTALSQTVRTDDNVKAEAIYHLNPNSTEGERIKYGSLEYPEPNTYHESIYKPIFQRSDFCLPCHDLTIRDIEAEITFTEWNRIPGLAMSGAFSCQECHMPQKSDGTHGHRFIGVDIDLSYPIGESPLHDAVQEMLESAVELQFGNPYDGLTESILFSSDSLIIPITVTNLTAHNLPSGTSFSREAWLEVIVTDGVDTLYKSGVVESTENLDTSDSDLLLFTTTLLNQDSVEVSSITQTYYMINNSLPHKPQVHDSYHIKLANTVSDSVIIGIRMLFRSFKPYHLQEGHTELLINHPELLENLPVFVMDSIRDTVYIQSSQ